MISVRRATIADGPRLWALNELPNAGCTADPEVSLDLPLPSDAPAAFPDLADVVGSFIEAGGEFLVAEQDGHLVGMGGVKPSSKSRAEVLRVRVHPAVRRRGVGRLVMNALEASAAISGFRELHLDTADNQPEAMSFYRSLGYTEVARESQPEWSWTLVYFVKPVA